MYEVFLHQPIVIKPGPAGGSNWDPVEPVAGPVRVCQKTGQCNDPAKPARPGGSTHDLGDPGKPGRDPGDSPWQI